MTRRCAVPGCSRLARPGGWTRCWEHLLEQLYAPRPPARPPDLPLTELELRWLFGDR